MPSKVLLIGTSKGLVEYRRSLNGWAIGKVHFQGMPVSALHVDEHTRAWWVGLAHRHWGQKLHYSADEGHKWQPVPTPVYPAGAMLKPGKPASLKKIWCLQGAGPGRPDGLWLGTEPGGLFYSDDNGLSFHLVESLWNHPSRLDENQWFGAGRDFPFIHSIVVAPGDGDHVYIAVSCAGVFETRDGGASWAPRNKGLVAAYLPNPGAEVGHDPHLLLACRARPEVLWQQNHCGIFRSVDGGQQWDNVTDEQGIANYGFALAVDHQNPERAWVIPAVSDEERVAHGLALCVCVTENGGRSWRQLRSGLPQEYCFDIVYRHALAISGNTLAFGTSTGNVYLSENEGEHWSCLSHNLASVDAASFG
ncbi:MAG: exo-alpha-sialidase [Lewinellaceae bacterium]|nr:exo-alpha-sialidase [Lewinellaceae bacterium]